MTTYVDARDTIVAYLHPAWTLAFPGTPIYYENTVQISLDSVGDSFLTVTIDFQDALREGVDARPYSKTWGEITLRIFSKEGKTTRSTLQLFDYLTALMKYRNLSGVTLDCPAPGKKISKDGWVSADLNVPFSFWQDAT